MLSSSILRFSDIPAETLRYFRSGRSNAASIYDLVDRVYYRIYSSYPHDVREGYADPDPLYNTGVTYIDLIDAARAAAEQTLADMSLPYPMNDLVDYPAPMEIDAAEVEHEEWPSEPVFQDTSAHFHYQAAHAIRTYGFVSIHDFYSHIQEGDCISLLYNGHTFEYTYSVVHRSDNRGYNVYCSDFMGHVMHTQTL